MTDELDWMKDGLCAQTDPEAFFPEKGKSPKAAKRVCASCPVRRRCYAYGLAHTELTGVWGGTTDRQRMAIRAGSASAAA